MREIIFRGKLINSEKWAYGNLEIKKTGTVIITPDETVIGRYGQVDRNTVGQYTGLKDKNGKEIYEGDIIDFSYDMFVGNFNTYVAKGIVIFEEGAFYVQCLENENMTKDESYLLYTINIDTIEIIGNIYDNPELLEKG